ncbi:MAG: hypothetical protein ACJA0Z_001878 [Halioglobus sp.]|jgi:hypothetical protein
MREDRMLTALGVVREKELGSITNLYAAPASKMEFLLSGMLYPYRHLRGLPTRLDTLFRPSIFRKYHRVCSARVLDSAACSRITFG